MEIESSENSNWLFDYELVDTMPVVVCNFPGSACGGFSLCPQPLNWSSNARLRSESCSASGSKACREKLRRDKLNERHAIAIVLYPLLTEKNELRDEKQGLKSDREKLEQQVNCMRAPGFLPHPSAVPTAFAAQDQVQATGKNLVPFIGYPGLAMWQFMAPAAVDTSQDHVLHPPVA
ncbi:hypothetical protein HS088_TW06G00204 [Tripterygium wilfordii]|uniref:BHLH domain-containing protein n=1 Tax=Tripterygium wilfordii TaxID=458696 RepID=A0A7J7DIC2_TRIWF|nr:hypothetical protein HS088_TW06G00204 [Tripterygium wilfordii]